jgi:glutaredoxin 3
MSRSSGSITKGSLGMTSFLKKLPCVLLALTLAGCATSVVLEYPQHQSPLGEVSRSYPKIVLYSTSWCPHCREAKEYFKRNHIAYVNRDVEEDGDAMKALVERYNSRAVPVIVIGNDEKILKGFKQEEFEKAYGEFKKAK